MHRDTGGARTPPVPGVNPHQGYIQVPGTPKCTQVHLVPDISRDSVARETLKCTLKYFSGRGLLYMPSSVRLRRSRRVLGITVVPLPVARRTWVAPEVSEFLSFSLASFVNYRFQSVFL